MKSLFLILTTFLFTSPVFARGGITNSVAVAQGVSSPATTSIINFSNGFTRENPVGVVYQSSIRLSGLFDDGDGSTGLGGEFGIGNGKYGLAVGVGSRDCDGCDTDVAAAIGGVLSGVGLGFRFQEDVYSLGILLNPNGQHRVGIMAELNRVIDNANFTSLAAGYSYVSGVFKFSVDASTAVFEDDTFDDDLLILTPGLAFTVSIITVSVSYDLRLNDDDSSNNDRDLWVGLGVHPSSNWELAVYADYFNDLAVSASFYF